MTTLTDAPARAPYELRLTAEVAREVGRYVSPIVETVATAFTERPDAPQEIIIDLSEATAAPPAQLVLLVTLLRRTLGPEAIITLSGVRPSVLSALVPFDLPPGTVVLDSRGRTGRGRTTTVRPHTDHNMTPARPRSLSQYAASTDAEVRYTIGSEAGSSTRYWPPS